ncbi:hypothetical protein CEXT_100511 [Caerostris extrusa]|uniref:Uncharacterized protein n=1 Tax=Caerostris extrusa TaxID=172846 RepID=A0AAV4M7T9_CAEEX|nr:hypothetical protein CEXT_100511 [Caerostris extrusa]
MYANFTHKLEQTRQQIADIGTSVIEDTQFNNCHQLTQCTINEQLSFYGSCLADSEKEKREHKTPAHLLNNGQSGNCKLRLSTRVELSGAGSCHMKRMNNIRQVRRKRLTRV